jgi:hypothetical protein
VSRKVHAGFERGGHRKRASPEVPRRCPISTADLALKERAIARTTPPDTRPGRYKPPDTLLAFLEAL